MSDAQQAASGKTVQFGLGQLTNPTPETAKNIFRAILYVSALWAVISPLATEIPPHVLATVDKWLLIGNAAINMTIKFFGWDFKS